MKKTRPIAIVFDLDGTLVDTMQTFADVAAEVMEKHHGADRATARRRYLETSGIPFHQQLEVIYPGDARNAAAAVEFERVKVERTGNVPPTQDDAEALASLKLAGFKLAVSSNNFQENVDLFIQVCPVPLDLVLGFADGFHKGGPHFERVMKTVGAKKSQLLFVGDSLKDGELAEEAGITFIGKTGTFPAAAFDAAGYDHVDSLTELAERLTRA